MLFHHLFHRRTRQAGCHDSILPLKNTSSEPATTAWRLRKLQLPKRYTRILVAGLVSVTVLWVLLGPRHDRRSFQVIPGEEETSPSGLPPIYRRFREYQRALPQNDPSLPYPEGRDAKFLFTANHVEGAGWGNSLQAIILNLYLAHEAKRAFVIHDFAWKNDGPDYAEFKGKIIPARIPISTLLAGPILGQSWEAGGDVPRPVSREYFETICPENERTVIKSDEVNKPSSPVALVDAWVKKLNSSGPCVEIEKNSLHIFDIWLFGSERVLDIWPSLSNSPILTKFAWSPLILSAYEANKALMTPRSFLSLPFMGSSNENSGLLALHIRRGDFEEHCTNLATWSSDWNGFNRFPELPDKFSPPIGEASPQKLEIYLRHCFPTIEQIVDKVMGVQAQTKRGKLSRIYMMTNAEMDWLEDLKAALNRAGSWDVIVTTKDLELTWEQKHVSQALDMLIGQRAQAFVGNGFSSLTSNVVMQRMAAKLPPQNTYFW